mgnify:CR=1 FL=1
MFIHRQYQSVVQYYNTFTLHFHYIYNTFTLHLL